MVRQEEEAKQGAAAAAEEEGTGEDQCHWSACNRRLRATQSPNDLRVASMAIQQKCNCSTAHCWRFESH